MSGTEQKILVVDDEAAIRDLVTATLGFGDFDVCTASNGEEALRVARRERPRLVFLDIRMPGLDGLEVCRRLKADPDLAACTVILLTAQSDEETRAAGRHAGADGYFTKPFSPLELLREVERILG
jgi:DNA-binding response OmpR family regulator